jgi:uncharacterized protein YnzC (UPF0291/DUF896 family)
MLKLEANDVLKTAQGVLVHWTKVNEALSMPLLLQGGYARSEFDTDVLALTTALQALPKQDNAYGLTLAARDDQKDVLKIRLKQFRAAVQSELAGTAFVGELGRQPHKLATEPVFLKAFDDMQDLWSRINTLAPPVFTPPLTLAGGYTLTEFQTELATMRTHFREAQQQTTTLTEHRQSVRAAANVVWERIKQYRKGCVAKLSTGHALLVSIP